MNNRAYVLEFRLAPTTNMDAKRVYTRRMTTDENGNPIKELVPCRVSVVASRELLLHSMRGSEMSHRVYFDANPNLREENRLEINGAQYILVGLPQNPSQVGALWQLDVRMITQQNELVKVVE
jgi:hypothetical protein